MIEAFGLSKNFSDFTAVDNLSFTATAGEIYGLLGPNGSGKTTTMRMLLGLLRPTSGTAKIMGHDLQTEIVAAKKLIGYVPEEATLPDNRGNPGRK